MRAAVPSCFVRYIMSALCCTTLLGQVEGQDLWIMKWSWSYGELSQQAFEISVLLPFREALLWRVSTWLTCLFRKEGQQRSKQFLSWWWQGLWHEIAQNAVKICRVGRYVLLTSVVFKGLLYSWWYYFSASPLIAVGLLTNWRNIWLP